MSPADTAAIIAAVALLLTAGFVAAVETVVDRLELVRALRLAEEEARGADPLLWLIEHRGTSMHVLMVLTVTLRISLAAVVTTLVVRHVGGAAGVVIAVAVTTLAALVLAETAPRAAVLRRLESAGLRLAPIARPIVRLLEPAAKGIVALGRGLAGGRRDHNGASAPEDDPGDRIASDDEDDEIEEDERAMIRSIFELGDTVVREIMVPRPDMVIVDRAAPLRHVVNTAIEHGFSRIPVFGESKDDVVGVIYAKDLLKRMAMHPGSDRWQDLIRPATFVPETKRIDDLLRSLQESTVHLAIVVDEYGGVVGLVTIEDILEEIVGEIVDEHDHEEPLVEVMDEGRVLVDARLPVDDLNELMDTELPDESWDTVGGLVIGTLGRVPVAGESVDIDGLTLRAERVQGRRVSKVLVVRRTDRDEQEGGE